MADILLGAGNQIFTATTPGDRIFGQDGNDRITASAGGNSLYGGDGDDVLRGGAGNDFLQGDDVPDITRRNVLNGLGGNDFIVSSSWLDQIDAGSGDDRVSSTAQTTGQIVNGGSGIDTIEIRSLSFATQPVNISMGATFSANVGGVNGATYTNFEVLTFFGGVARNTIQGGNGDDFLLTAYLNGSNATNEFDAGFVNGKGGNDTIAFNGIARLGSGIQSMTGGLGTDKLSWTIGTSGITDLVIDARAGTMIGMGRTFCTFSGFESVDFRTYSGHTGVLTYDGSDGIDGLLISFTSSTIRGFGGNDSFIIDSGSSVTDGGAGDDRISISFGNAAAHVVRGGAGNDAISGGAGQSQFYGEGDDDVIVSSNGRSGLYGGSGNDSLTLTNRHTMAGSGPAILDGGSGRDAMFLDLSAFAGSFSQNLGKNTYILDDGTQVFGCEAMTFTSGNFDDVLISSNDPLGIAANIVNGGGGNDALRASANGALLDGGGGNDTLTGGAGVDRLQGNSGDDLLRGGDGNDQMVGNFGEDTMIGGLGADSFIFAFTFDTSITTGLWDVIADFSHAEADRIDLSLIDANALSLSNDVFALIGSAAFGNVAGELRVQRVNLPGSASDHTLLQGDTDGNGTANFTIEFTGLYTFVGADFIL